MRFFTNRARLLLLVVPVAAMALFITNALAVHDEVFQLDGDVTASTQTHVPSGATQLYDWDSLFTATGANKPPPTADFKSAGFNKDFSTNTNGSFNTSDSTTFATGSKDILPITPGWQCNRDSNVNSKIDIMNAYATAYEAANGDQLLYFALERNSNSGDGNVGFWFLQDEVGCVSPGGTTSFSGDHQDGDLLVVSAFTNGGTVSTIDVYRWNGGANGSLGTTPVAHGADCAGEAVGDEACAEVNSGTITTPWQTANKQDGVGHSLRTSEFFEGGVNLTKKGLGGHCFNVFLADTRSSQSLTATLFDFARGQLGSCTSSTTTTPKQLNTTTGLYEDFPATNPPGGTPTVTLPASGTLTVKDSAEISVNPPTAFNGTVSFFLCTTAATSSTLCTTGGTAKGVRSITANGTVLSDAVDITQPGRYCWRADFSGDDAAGVPPSSDSAATECFIVQQIPTKMSTTPKAYPQDSMTIQSTVTGDNLAADGTVNFRLYEAGGGNSALQNCQAHGTTVGTGGLLYAESKLTGAAANSQTVSTNNTTVAISNTSAASYYWRVTYAPPNTDASHTGRQSDCVENVQATFTGDSFPGTLFP